MKKITLLIATLFAVSLIITGCDRNEPTPEPTPQTYTVVYKIDNHVVLDEDLVMSPCLKMNVTYTDANGQLVTENNVTLPWSKSVDTKLPFHAKMTGTITYNEEELPATVVYGLVHGIGLLVNGEGDVPLKGNMKTSSKENFLTLASTHPEYLQFTEEKDF